LKLHTWIVLGMVVGVLAGWLIGPDSPVLSGEVIVIKEGRAPVFYDGIEGLALESQPPRGRLVLRAISSRNGWIELEETGDGARRLFARATELPVERYSPFGLGCLSLFGFFGEIFLRLLKMLVVPLVAVSLTAGVASLGDPRKLGKLGLSTLGFFFVTTAVSVSIGLVLATVAAPGETVPAAERDQLAGPGEIILSTADIPTISERLRDMIPENPVRALADGDMLALIFFAVMIGISVCLLVEDKARPMLTLLDAATETMVRMVHLVMIFAPVGVLAMMATVTASSGINVLLSLLYYAVIVITGLLLHVGLCYVPALRFLAKVPIIPFFKAAWPAQILTFATSSSSAALPVSLQCARKGMGVSRQTATFVLPVGATVNMDGTALYQGVATVFIAQLYGLDLGITDLAQVVLMATIASVGAAGVPGAGMVTLTMVLTSLGLPIEGVAIIMGVDRLIDMFRSAVNVTGDLTCTCVVARLQGERPGYLKDSG